MFNFSDNSVIMDNIIKQGDENRITDKQFIVREINRFKISRKRHNMLTGVRYFKGDHDIMYRKRTMIGSNGKLEEVENLPNERIVDNQYKKMVMQKNNYLLGQPFSIHCDNDVYVKLLQSEFFNKKFFSLLLKLGTDFLNCGIAWVFVHYDEEGKLAFKRIKPYEVIPGWKDADHTILEYAIHIYSTIQYEGTNDEKIVEFVEVFDENGITYFQLTDGGSLIPTAPYHSNYFTVTTADNLEEGYNWSRIPLIPLKYNDDEIPLIKNVKSLQDGINIIESNFLNCMEEDVRNTILVLVNYDGTNLGEFRKNLATYGAVKVTTVDGSAGDLKTLEVEVNSENYKAILEVFKKAIIENAMGYDAKDDRLSGNPNEMNIQSMYSDIDLDANGIETLLQASFEELLWFINMHLYNTGYGDFEGEVVDIIFNRDMLINESTVIDNCTKSVGILSDETIIANHPWVDDPVHEIERLKKQKEENIDQYGNAFLQNNQNIQNEEPDDESGDDE
jgi:SPP1 family phage portal protein